MSFVPTTENFTYNFTYTNSINIDVDVNVTFTATNSIEDPNTYNVTAASGTANGSQVTGLSGFGSPDQKINISGINPYSSTTTGFGYSGVSFETADGSLWNFYYDTGINTIWTNDNSGEIPSSFQVLPTVACFLPGTLITTTIGDVVVEDLQIGDLIPTISGQIVPVKWIGMQQYEGRFLSLKRSTVCFKEGALGLNSQGCRIPTQDLYVTADHAMVMHGFLVNSARLVNGITITQETTKELVKVYHVDLGEHHAILANGAWTESYREVNTRHRFNNSEQYLGLYPEAMLNVIQEPCLPEVSGQNLLAVTKQIFSYVPEDKKTADPDVHLYVDGEVIEPTRQSINSYTFSLSAGAKNIRLMSQTSSPLETGQAMDNRKLGYCIHELVYSNDDDSCHLHIAPHSPLLEQGFYKAEEQRRRWTKGNAVLPTSPFTEQTILTIKGRSLSIYLHSASRQARKLSAQPKHELSRAVG